jgi:hypothetical protein
VCVDIEGMSEVCSVLLKKQAGVMHSHKKHGVYVSRQRKSGGEGMLSSKK